MELDKLIREKLDATANWKELELDPSLSDASLPLFEKMSPRGQHLLVLMRDAQYAGEDEVVYSIIGFEVVFNESNITYGQMAERLTEMFDEDDLVLLVAICKIEVARGKEKVTRLGKEIDELKGTRKELDALGL